MDDDSSSLTARDISIHQQKRLESLMVGVECNQQFRFSKSLIHLRLTENEAELSWRTVGAKSIKHSNLSVTSIVRIEARGEKGMRFFGASGDSELEVIFQDESTRDSWITATNELLARRDSRKARQVEHAPNQDAQDRRGERWEEKYDELERRREGRLSLRQ